MSASSEKRFGRRGALMGLGAVATTAAAGLPSLDGHAQPRVVDEPRPEPHEPLERPDVARAHGLSEPDESVRDLFSRLEPGTVLEGHWRVERVYGLRAGAIPVVLSGGGRRFAVELFRYDPSGPAPVGQAEPIAVHLSNRGDGDDPSDELAGLGAQALARALGARIAVGARAPEGLSTHAQRRAQHPTGIFHVPLD